MSITVCRNPDEIPPGFYITDCAVSGGTLEAFLKTAMELSGGKLCVRISPMATEFPLPCRSGVGAAVSEKRLEELRKKYPCRFSPALVMEYMSFLEAGQVHVVLFDTEETLKRKRALAEQLGIPMVLHQGP